MSTPDSLEEINPLYKPELLIDTTQEQLTAKAADNGMMVVPATTGKHGNVLCVGPTGNIWDSTVLLVSPDTGKIYADNLPAKKLIDSYLAT